MDGESGGFDNASDASPADGGFGGSVDASVVDAASCPATAHIELRINGIAEPVGSSSPLVHAVLGDVLELSAAGSCTQTGSREYSWEITPSKDIGATAAPDLFSETITVYPVAVGDYTVDLAMSDGAGMSIGKQVLGFRVHGWQQRGPSSGNNVRGLDVGPHNLWIAAEQNAFRSPLTDGLGQIVEVNPEIGGDSLDNNLEAVYVDRVANMVWFGKREEKIGVWRLDRNGSMTIGKFVKFDDSDALGTKAEIKHIGPGLTGVALATNIGLTESANNDVFTGRFPAEPDLINAVAAGGGHQWAAGSRLFDRDGDTEHNPFDLAPGVNSTIQALAVDPMHDELWVGAKDYGVARVRNSTGMVLERYAPDSSDLSAGEIRDLRVETQGRYAGDVWAATDVGALRYLRRRNLWLSIPIPSDLGHHSNLRAVAIDETDGRRAIYAGSQQGLVYTGVP